MEETARRILRLVREKDHRYGQIAVITGNLEEYGSVAAQVFEDAGIPYFIDEKHSILMNPFVEYLRAHLRWSFRDSVMRVYSVISAVGCLISPEVKRINWKIM